MCPFPDCDLDNGPIGLGIPPVATHTASMTSSRARARLSVGLAGILIGAVALAGCGSSADSAGVPMPEGVMAQPEGMMPPADAAGGSAPAPVEKSVITTGGMSVQVADVAAAESKVRTIVQGVNGQIDQLSETVNPDEQQDRTANVTIRVPADQFVAVQDQIAALGTVTGRSISQTDVTIQVVDVNARIAALQASITRLQSLITQATSTASLIEAENALTARQSELDSLKSQQAYLNDQVGMSTLTIDLTWEGAGGSTNTALILLLVGLVVGIGIGLFVWLIVILVRRGSRPTA